MTAIVAEWPGFCPICRSATTFRAYDPWFRDHLICLHCPGYSVPRERALMLLLDRLRPDWRHLTIHESSPAARGVSPVLARECANYTPSQFFPDVVPGQDRGGVRCENIEALTFGDEAFDVVITQDVMEHVFHPWLAYQEIHRTLRPGGLYLHTTPIYSGSPNTICRAELSKGGEVCYLLPPEYHGNPIDDAGSLVTFYFGRDFPKKITEWAAFSVEIVSFNDRHHGVLGEFTEVIACVKPAD